MASINVTCEECDDDCKWEVPFWILLAALLTLLTLLGLAALYRFCCKDRQGLCASEDEENEVYSDGDYDSGTTEFDDDYGDYGGKSSYDNAAYSSAPMIAGGAAGAGYGRKGYSSRKARRKVKVKPKPPPQPATDPSPPSVVTEQTAEVKTVSTGGKERNDSTVSTGADEVFETGSEGSDDGSDDDDNESAYIRNGRRRNNKASLSRFKYTIVDWIGGCTHSEGKVFEGCKVTP